MRRLSSCFVPILTLVLVPACAADDEMRGGDTESVDPGMHGAATSGGAGADGPGDPGDESGAPMCMDCPCPGGAPGFSCPEIDNGACQCTPGAETGSSDGDSMGCRAMFDVSGTFEESYDHAEAGCEVLVGSFGAGPDDFLGLFVGPLYIRIPMVAGAGTHESEAVGVELTDEIDGREIDFGWEGCVGSFEIEGATDSISFRVEGSVDCSGIVPDAFGNEPYEDLSEDYQDLAIAPFDFSWRF